MALSPALNDFGSSDSVVDRRIGTAFSYVQVVANSIKEVKYVAYYMEGILTVANNYQSEVSKLATGTALANPTHTLIPYPAGVTNDNLRSSSVIIVGTDDVVYNAVPGNNCVWTIENGFLDLILGPSAAAGMIGGQVRWHITHSPD